MKSTVWNMIRCRDQKNSKAVYYSFGVNYMIIKDFWKGYIVTNVRTLYIYTNILKRYSCMRVNGVTLSSSINQPSQLSYLVLLVSSPTKHTKSSGLLTHSF